MSHAQRVILDAKESYAASERETKRWNRATDVTLPLQTVLSAMVILTVLWKPSQAFQWALTSALLGVCAWNTYAMVKSRLAWKSHGKAFTELLAAECPEYEARIREAAQRRP